MSLLLFAALMYSERTFRNFCGRDFVGNLISSFFAIGGKYKTIICIFANPVPRETKKYLPPLGVSRHAETKGAFYYGRNLERSLWF